MTQYKQLKLVTNHKTNKQRIEYRIYSNDSTFKTCAPRAWKALELEDKTEYSELLKCNRYLVRSKIKDNMRLGIELNETIHRYVSQCMTKDDAYYSFATKHGIIQL